MSSKGVCATILSVQQHRSTDIEIRLVIYGGVRVLQMQFIRYMKSEMLQRNTDSIGVLISLSAIRNAALVQRECARTNQIAVAEDAYAV